MSANTGGRLGEGSAEGSRRRRRLPAAPPPLTNQDFGGRVVHADGFEDGGAVVGHRHGAALPPAEQDFILVKEALG